MSKNKGMSKGLKTAIIIVIILLLLAGGIVGGILALGNHSQDLPDVEIPKALATPQNIVVKEVNNKWILTFDAVEGAVAYNVIADGESFTENSTAIDVTEYVKGAGSHTFEVRALHSRSAYHSEWSDPYTKETYVKLNVPANINRNALNFSWGRVSNAMRYDVYVIDNLNRKDSFCTVDTQYNLSSYLAQHSDIQSFKVKVRASPMDMSDATDILDETKIPSKNYVTVSEWTDFVLYAKADSISKPVITKDFGDVTYVDYDKSRNISWVIKDDEITSDFVDYFEVYCDGLLIKKIARDEFINETKYTFSLQSYSTANSLGNHSVYIKTIPMSGVDVIDARSESIDYTIHMKLAQVNSESIHIGSSIGSSNLLFEMYWEGVENAKQYEIELYGKGTDSDFALFNTLKNITDTRYTIGLGSIQSYNEVCIRVRAIGDGVFIEDGDLSNYSSSMTTTTKLSAVISVTVNEDSDTGSVTISWVGLEGNDKAYLDKYYVKVTSVTDSKVYGFYVENNKQSIVISDELRSLGASAGKYETEIIAMPSSKYEAYYKQSDTTKAKDTFTYKTRLSTPVIEKNGISRTNETLTMNFVGSVGAEKYVVYVSYKESGVDYSPYFEIGQPQNYTSGATISDTTGLSRVLGSKTKPQTYNITMYAVPSSEQTGTIMNSATSQTYQYNDIFKHNAVEKGSIVFTQTGNSLSVSWTPVDTATNGYSYTLTNLTTKKVFTGETDTASADLTSAVKDSKGQYQIAVTCKTISLMYEASESTLSNNYDYKHYVLEDEVEFAFKFNKKTETEEPTINISIPYFDKVVTGYAIQIGEKQPQPMTINKSAGTVSYNATFTELPAYTPTDIKILVGVKISNNAVVTNESGAVVEDYVQAIREILYGQKFVNINSAEPATISYSLESGVYAVTFTLANETVAQYAQSIEWWVTQKTSSSSDKTREFGRGYVIASAEESHLQQISTITNLCEALGVDSLPVGEYQIYAVVTYQSGLVSDSSCLSKAFTVKFTLPEISGIVADETNYTYLQWNKVEGATSYNVKVTNKEGEEVGTINVWNELTINSQDVIRISTVDLFNTNGAGEYTFTVTASADYADSVSKEYTWSVSNKIPTPVVDSVYTDSEGNVFIRVLNNSITASYIVTIKGENDQNTEVTKVKGNAIYEDIELCALKGKAGAFQISVVAVPSENSDRDNSDPNTKNYDLKITASQPSGVTVSQAESGGAITVNWSVEKVPTYAIWSIDENGNVSSESKSASLVFTIADENGSFYTENGSKKEFTIINLGDTTYASDSDLVKFLNQNNANMYYLYFVTRVDSDFVSDSSPALLVRLSYQVTLSTPILAFETENARLAEGGKLNFIVSNLDENANNLVDIQIKNASDEVVAMLTGQNVGSSDMKTFTLNSSVLAKCGAGSYTISARASQNGIFRASDYSNPLTFTYATKVGEVSGIVVTPKYTPASGDGESKTAAKYELTISFDKLTTTCDYEVKMTYGTSSFTFTSGVPTDNKVSFTLDYTQGDEYENLRKAMGANIDKDLELKFNITATPKDNTTAEAQTTTYVYKVGKISAPTNFVFTDNGENIEVTWSGDANYANYTKTYSVQAWYKSNADSNWQTATITDGTNKATSVTSEQCFISGLDLTQAYLIKFEVSVSATNSDGLTAQSEGATTIYWANTKQTGDAAAEITYDTSNCQYVVTINHNSGNGPVFSGQTYTLLLDDCVIVSAGSADKKATATTFYIGKDNEIFAKLVNLANRKNTNIAYTIIIRDATVTPVESGESYIGYSGKTCENTLATLPIVITQKPNVTVDTAKGVAYWDPIANATEYSFVIKDSEGTEVYSATIENFAGKHDFSACKDDSKGWSELAGGKYTIEVSVVDDEDNKVYATSEATFSEEVTKYKSVETATPTAVTTSNGCGDFTTTISWIYPLENGQLVDVSRFVVTLTSVATGVVTELTKESGAVITCTTENTYYRYNLVLGGRNLKAGLSNGKYSIIGFDPTRDLPAGEYALGLKVTKNPSDEYSADSEFKYTSYQNKFGVVAVNASEAFSVAPECYATTTSDTLTWSTEELAKYEKEYGFNKKFFVLSKTGQSLNVATHYLVKINGQEFTITNSGLEGIDFASLKAFENKLLLNGEAWKPGKNTITIMPIVASENAEYYYYIEDEETGGERTGQYEARKLTETTALAKDFTVTFYKKFSTPSDSRLNINYNDLAKKNVSQVNVTFANSATDNIYSVVVHYYDYYNNSAEQTFTIDKISASDKSGLELYPYIEHLGPHKIWFEINQVGQTGLGDDEAQYYIASDTITTKEFDYTTSVQEFATKEADEGGRAVSVVTAVDYQNELATNLNNGTLRWTLPIHAYDVQIKYIVTLKDSNENVEAFSAILNVVWNSNDQKLDYSLQKVGNKESMFKIDNEFVYFDMTKFFENDTDYVTNRSTSYLAGNYSYKIKAEAFDKNGQPTALISSPVNTYPASDFASFVYKNIKYPVAPSNVKITYENGQAKLTWEYGEDKYSTGTKLFGIAVVTTDLNGNTVRTEVVEKSSFDEYVYDDIERNLVAGGSQYNKVYVYRIAPDDNYLNSREVLAEFDGNYPNTRSMPSITAEWSGANSINYGIDKSISAERLTQILTEFKTNNKKASFYIDVARVSVEEYAQNNLTGNTYDDIINNSSLKSKLTANFTASELPINQMLDSQAELSYSFDLLKNLENLADEKVKNKWISSNRLAPGVFFVKVSLKPDTEYSAYTASTANILYTVKEMWNVVNASTATLEGEYLTTKERDAEANPKKGYDRLWAGAEQREAKLTFLVNSITGSDNQPHVPSKVTVKVKLWNGESYSETTNYSLTYSIPALTALDAQHAIAYSEDGDVALTYGDNGTYKITINIHKLFDSTENYASEFAGVYHLDWIIEEDEFGSTSDANLNDVGTTWYSYAREICHYTVIQTPILDYRMDMFSSGGNYLYMLNWTLTPNKFNFVANENIDYNLNIFAFEEQGGEYACDSAYNELSDKTLFLQDVENTSGTTSYGFDLEKCILNFSTTYTNSAGKRCYINYSSNKGLELTPNKNYKFFMYLSPKTIVGSNADPNIKYYLTSETSAPVVYKYKEISPAISYAEIKATSDNQYAIENQEDFESKKIYSINAVQYNNGFNNAFELFIYDTQVVGANDNDSWTTIQEENNNYRAHYILTTLNNAGTDAQSLYVIDNYKENMPKTEYSYWSENGKPRAVGTLTNRVTSAGVESTITLYDFTLSELLGYKADIPITYYCKIKTWIDNNEVNANANVNADGEFESVSRYGADWVKRYINLSQYSGEEYENRVEGYVEALQNNYQETSLADFNSLNPSFYFTFQHKIRFATPSISKIEILNTEENGTAVVDTCAVDYKAQSQGTTAGYISAKANISDTLKYQFKIYLDNVYNKSLIVQNDKYIKLKVSARKYDKGELTSTVEAYPQDTTFKVYYEGETAYIIIKGDSEETGAPALFNWIDERLPNELQFIATAVQSGRTASTDTSINVGGQNTANTFKLKSGKSQSITRTYLDSTDSDPVKITVRKQYATPEISFMFDDSTSKELISDSYTRRVGAGNYVSNVLSTGSYAGMALNPYLYVSPNIYGRNGAQGGSEGFEYARLTNNDATNYEVTFKYGTNSKTITFSTKSINATLTEFTKAVNNNANRYDYTNYKDIYPYEYACLYETLYNLINESRSAGEYIGGQVDLTIRVVAPADSTAGNWVSSESSTTTMAFYVRLETVKTQFEGTRSFTDSQGEYHQANQYAEDGRYYYYQAQIPFNFSKINKDTLSNSLKYRVILTRPITNEAGQETGEYFTYSYEDLERLSLDYSTCVWTANSTEEFGNVGNIADILGIDRYNDATKNDFNYNQWLLDSTWTINILAYADDSLNQDYITRGFDSKVQTYTPKLKLINDINDISIQMKVNQAEKTVENFTKDDITIKTEYTAQSYNSAVTQAVFTYDVGNGETTKTMSIKQDSDSRYLEMIYDFITQVFINERSVMGGEYEFSVKLTNPERKEKVEDSLDSAKFKFIYYKQINAEDLNLSVTQSGTRVNFSSSTSKANSVIGLSVVLAQTNISTSKLGEYGSQVLSVSESGDTIRFSGSKTFSTSTADCFSSVSYTADVVSLLTQSGYVSSGFTGSIQAGVNIFRFYPIQNAEQAKYNLLGSPAYITKTLNYKVPTSLCPSVSLYSSTGEDGGGKETFRHTETWTCPNTACENGKVWTRCSNGCQLEFIPDIDEEAYAITISGTNKCPFCTNGWVVDYGYEHDLVTEIDWKGIRVHCQYCGASIAQIMRGKQCTHKVYYDTLSQCARCTGTGSYSYSYVVPCDKCGGEGYKWETCGTCQGTPTKSTTTYSTKYYAYYKYVTALRASFSNNGGCTVSGSWSYGWSSRHSSCTKSSFSRSGSASSFSGLSSITLSGANYASFSVTIKCKQYFEACFERPTYSTSISPNYVSEHYETYVES